MRNNSITLEQHPGHPQPIEQRRGQYVEEYEGIVHIYPESDGQPMSDNTKQFRWIVIIKENLEALYRNDPEVFVAGDLLWYPVRGRSKIRRAPDAMVVFGRPKGDRGSYLQWLEDNIAPQVVFEVLSPGNTAREMQRKLAFYDEYGVEEYYLYDPDNNRLSGWLRRGAHLHSIAPTIKPTMDGWVSPRLGIRFDMHPGELCIYAPNGERFYTFDELKQLHEQERLAHYRELHAREQAEARWEEERRAREQAEAELQKLRAQLRSLGMDPDGRGPAGNGKQDEQQE